MPERIPPPSEATRITHCTSEQYESMYRRSLDDPDGFWSEAARRIDWYRAPTIVGNWSFDPVDVRWFEDGILNL